MIEPLKGNYNPNDPTPNGEPFGVVQLRILNEVIAKVNELVDVANNQRGEIGLPGVGPCDTGCDGTPQCPCEGI